MAKGEEGTEKNGADLDKYAKDALDEIFSKEEQSYEDFLEGFMFLKKDDVTGVKSPGYLDQGTSSKDIQYSPKETLLKTQEDNDSVPEEILGPGFSTPSIIMRTVESSGGSVLQVDNFVDIEDGTSSDSEDSTEEDIHVDDDPAYSATDYSPSLAISSKTSNKSVGLQSCNDNVQGHLAAGREDSTLEVHELQGVSNLPGEVDDQEISEQETGVESVKPNERQLQISTRPKECDQADKPDSLQQDAEETCEVQPFTLDADFDYDNVALTPKFDFLPQRKLGPL